MKRRDFLKLLPLAAAAPAVAHGLITGPIVKPDVKLLAANEVRGEQYLMPLQIEKPKPRARYINPKRYPWIHFELLLFMRAFGVDKIGFDPWELTQLATYLSEKGIKTVEVRRMGSAKREIDALIAEHSGGDADLLVSPVGRIWTLIMMPASAVDYRSEDVARSFRVPLG